MQTAFFLDGPSGRLFCTGYLHPTPDDRRRYLVLAPFGEEMNKSRHVLAALVRRLGAAGHDVLLPDLFGTGDSEGELGDASIDAWREDIAALIERLAGTQPVHLIGLRAGALLAVDALARHAAETLTLIQPLADGRQQLNQLLRLRLAGGLMGDRKSETAAELRAQLADGQALEVAGYLLSPAMATGLESLKLGAMRPDTVDRVHWLELVAEAGRPLMPVSQRVVDEWSADGTEVDTETVACDSFWATQEIAQCPAVVDAVCRYQAC